MHPTYLDFIYKQSSINYFMDVHRVDAPHFAITDDRYIATDHFVVEAKMPLYKVEQIKREYGMDVHSAFIETLIKKARVELEEQFLTYIESNCAEIDAEYYQKHNKIDFSKVFRRNSRIRLKTGTLRKRDIKKGAYFLAFLADLYKENLFMTQSAYILVGKDLAAFIASSVNEFSKATDTAAEYIKNIEEFDNTFIVPIGLIEMDIGNVNVLMSDNVPDYTFYLGMRSTTGLGLFYYISPDLVSTHETLPKNPMDIETIYRLNMHHTFSVINHKPQMKKILFNDADQ